MSTRSFIEWRVFFYGTYEERVSPLMRAFVPSGGVAVDDGANVGVHTLEIWTAACARPRPGILIACEPRLMQFSQRRASRPPGRLNARLDRSEMLCAG